MSRRKFLKDSLCAGLGASAAAAMLGKLTGVAAATPVAAMQDYKALVCIFLYGGNDSDNTLVPYGQTEYNAYAAARTAVALPRTSLLPITPATSDGRQWALHPSLPELQTLFGQKRLALVANMGPLLAPTTRAQYQAKSVPLPPQLFSHSDQQTHWQTAWPDQIAKTGWGGRMADVINSFNGSAGQISMSVTVAGSNVFQIGSQVFPYSVSTNGAIDLWYYKDAWNNAETVVTRTMLAGSYSNLFDKTYSQTFRNAIDNEKRLNNVLKNAPTLTTVFPTQNKLADQLKMVAKLISVRAQLGLKRQVFFCDLQGFDTHGEQLTTQAGLLAQASKALLAFYQATIEMGVASNVTTFTASDFGRTYKSNGKGTDHGWGSHQLVLGGAVNGGDIYGKLPVQTINGPDDTSDGRWIPTTAIDEYAATLAQWFGVAANDVPQVLPNIGRFNRSNLGFLS